MRLYVLSLVGALSFSPAWSHEMTPTYFELKPSYMEGIMVTTMKMFNQREDIRYYQISVFDKDWNTIPFATSNEIVKLNYLEKTAVDIYVRQKDINNIEYICTRSKIVEGEVISSAISSRICSKLKDKE